MKRIAAIILVLALSCTALCGCEMHDGIISDKNGTLTDNEHPVSSAAPSAKPDDNGKDKGTNGSKTPSDPQQTAVPGTSVITP